MRQTPSLRPYGTPPAGTMSWWALGRGADSLHAQAAYGVSFLLALNRVFWHQVTQYVACYGADPQLMGGDFNFDLNYMLPPPPPSVLASLLVRRLVDADLELASAFGRGPLCSYQGPQGTRPSRIDGLLVDTRLAALLHAASCYRAGPSLATPQCVSTCT